MVGDWKSFLAEEQEKTLNDIRKHERTGRPLGTAGFVEGLELELGRKLKRNKPGPKGRSN
jgi:putative transposase